MLCCADVCVVAGLQVLGKMPNKTFTFSTSSPVLEPLSLPEGTTPQAALERVLRLPSVCSKRFLTTKVDRHVTGGSSQGLAGCSGVLQRVGVLCVVLQGYGLGWCCTCSWGRVMAS